MRDMRISSKVFFDPEGMMRQVIGDIEYATVWKKTGNSCERNRDIDDVLASSVFEYGCN